MFTYILALVPFLFLFSSPIVNFFSGSGSGHHTVQQIHRLPRPSLNEDLLALEDPLSSNLSCAEHDYRVYIYSRAPLVIYVENFLSASEREHLLELAEGMYQPSTVTHDGGNTQEGDRRVRDSEVAMVNRTGVVRCIEARARGFQGWQGEVWVERLRMQRYGTGGHYSGHFDWSSGRGGWGRVGSWMGKGDGEGEKAGGVQEGENGKGGLKGGGTEFPLLKRQADERWCERGFVACDKKGVTFNVVPGNAVYWENFRADGSGRGWEETWHAGLPVEEGVKVGLNIWSWGRIE
ncbi:prolyl 4-hydroxylase subunit alpha-3 [Podospora australis]|uniref:Prolyl 4-hydroxylase subunit alpha-3 n=1 Tax=Podospora australis TaxID=1536484 RepID=A0AAN6WXP0_9PEZI|nr:prolyl 4-hydroxylase subunit alpha-3 [Podospora australis]